MRPCQPRVTVHGAAFSYPAQIFTLVHIIARSFKIDLHHLRVSSNFTEPVLRAEVGQRRAAVLQTRAAWNSLPPSVRSTSSLASFCLHLKTHLFAASFPR